MKEHLFTLNLGIAAENPLKLFNRLGNKIITIDGNYCPIFRCDSTFFENILDHPNTISFINYQRGSIIDLKEKWKKYTAGVNTINLWDFVFFNGLLFVLDLGVKTNGCATYTNEKEVYIIKDIRKENNER